MMYSVDVLNLTFYNVLQVILGSVLLGLLIAFTYWFTHRNTGFRSSILLTVIMTAPILAIIVTVIYTVIGNNLGRAISIGGGLALIRFRTNLADPRDMIYIYFSLAVGVITGAGLLGIGLLFTAVLSLFLIFFSLVGLDRLGGRAMKLRILVPEDINYEGMFDGTLKKYCSFCNLDRVRTVDYGTLLELQYRIRLKKKSEQKAMLDELRICNGNLEISLTQNISED